MHQKRHSPRDGGWLAVGGIRKDKFADNLDKRSWFPSTVTEPSSIVQGRGFRGSGGKQSRLEETWRRWFELAGLEERR